MKTFIKQILTFCALTVFLTLSAGCVSKQMYNSYLLSTPLSSNVNNLPTVEIKYNFDPPLTVFGAGEHVSLNFIVTNTSNSTYNGIIIKTATVSNALFDSYGPFSSIGHDSNGNVMWDFSCEISPNESIDEEINLFSHISGSYKIIFNFYKSDGITPLRDKSNGLITQTINFNVESTGTVGTPLPKSSNSSQLPDSNSKNGIDITGSNTGQAPNGGQLMPYNIGFNIQNISNEPITKMIIREDNSTDCSISETDVINLTINNNYAGEEWDYSGNLQPQNIALVNLALIPHQTGQHSITFKFYMADGQTPFVDKSGNPATATVNFNVN